MYLCATALAESHIEKTDAFPCSGTTYRPQPIYIIRIAREAEESNKRKRTIKIIIH